MVELETIQSPCKLHATCSKVVKTSDVWKRLSTETWLCWFVYPSYWRISWVLLADIHSVSSPSTQQPLTFNIHAWSSPSSLCSPEHLMSPCIGPACLWTTLATSARLPPQLKTLSHWVVFMMTSSPCRPSHAHSSVSLSPLHSVVWSKGWRGQRRWPGRFCCTPGLWSRSVIMQIMWRRGR